MYSKKLIPYKMFNFSDERCVLRIAIQIITYFYNNKYVYLNFFFIYLLYMTAEIAFNYVIQNSEIYCKNGP